MEKRLRNLKGQLEIRFIILINGLYRPSIPYTKKKNHIVIGYFIAISVFYDY